MSSKPASPAKPSSPAKNKAKVAPKKALKTTPSHPTWVDMIKVLTCLISRHSLSSFSPFLVSFIVTAGMNASC